MTAAKCKKLAAQIGCKLEVIGSRGPLHVTIWLPEGKQVMGNSGLDCLCSEGETPAEAWSCVLADLRTLADGGMEDFTD